MLTLKEGWTKNGNIHKYVLGTPTTAEMVVEWSKRQKPGAQFTRCLLWGLVAIATAAGTQPSVQFFLKEDLLLEFLKGIAPLEGMYLSGMGIAACLFSESGAPAKVALYVETPEENHVLHNFDATLEPRLVPLGQLDLTLEGPIWRDVAEMTEDNATKTQRKPTPTPPAPREKKNVSLPIDDYEACGSFEVDPGAAEDAAEAWLKASGRASRTVGR